MRWVAIACSGLSTIVLAAARKFFSKIEKKCLCIHIDGCVMAKTDEQCLSSSAQDRPGYTGYDRHPDPPPHRGGIQKTPKGFDATLFCASQHARMRKSLFLTTRPLFWRLLRHFALTPLLVPQASRLHSRTAGVSPASCIEGEQNTKTCRQDACGTRRNPCPLVDWA